MRNISLLIISLLFLFVACEEPTESELNKDCAGVSDGTAYIDSCGNCVGGTTGLVPCVIDCNGDWGGKAFIDDCGVCTGGTTGLEPNYAKDCYGECFGEAIEDCNGDCNGTAFENECGCVGGNTGLEEDFCYGCTNPEAINYNPSATIDDGSCENPAPEIVVSISLDSGDCNSCNSGNPGGEGIMAVCYSCYQIVLDYLVENIGTANAYNIQVRFKVNYEPFTNYQHSQTSWYSDIINVAFSLGPGDSISGSIVAVDYSYYNGTILTTYNNVRVYLNHLGFSD